LHQFAQICTNLQQIEKMKSLKNKHFPGFYHLVVFLNLTQPEQQPAGMEAP